MGGKIFAFLIFGLMFISLLGIVMAADNIDTAKQAVSDVASGATNAVVQQVLEPLFSQGEYLTKFFFFILVWMLIHSLVAESLFKGNRLFAFVGGFIISVLAVLWIPDAFLTAIRDQYGIMGGVLLSVIPFLIILLFSVRVGSALAGRVVWIFYMCYYFGVYAYRVYSNVGGWTSADNLIYLAAIAAGVLMFFVVGAIKSAIFKGEMGAIKESGSQIVQRGRLLHRLQKKELEEVYGDEEAAKG